MAKRKNSANLKGTLDVDFNAGVGTVTEIVKEVESEYDFFKLLEEFNGKFVTISITEENELPAVGDSE